VISDPAARVPKFTTISGAGFAAAALAVVPALALEPLLAAGLAAVVAAVEEAAPLAGGAGVTGAGVAGLERVRSISIRPSFRFPAPR
jgi:hypothetical protein